MALRRQQTCRKYNLIVKGYTLNIISLLKGYLERYSLFIPFFTQWKITLIDTDL